MVGITRSKVFLIAQFGPGIYIYITLKKDGAREPECKHVQKVLACVMFFLVQLANVEVRQPHEQANKI